MAAAALAQASQPAVLEAAQAAGAAEQSLSAQVGTDAWENQVGQKVVYMVGSEEQTASLTLNPPDLGPLQVVLSVTNDQASVTFSSNQRRSAPGAGRRPAAPARNDERERHRAGQRQRQRRHARTAARPQQDAAPRRGSARRSAGRRDRGARPASTRRRRAGDRAMLRRDDGLVDTFA